MNFLKAILIIITSLLFFGCSQPETALKPLLSSDVILAFGDSITYGTGATQETSYPAALEKLIRMKVINAGVPGEETRDSLLRISKLLDQYNPKLVIVCLGGNDLLRKRPWGDIKKNLSSIINIIQAHGAQVVLIAVPVISYNLDVPAFYSELGREFSIPIELSAYRELISNPQYKADYIHLNALGYQQLSEKVATLLKEHSAIN